MEISYRTDGINSYMVLDDTSLSPDSYEVNMISNNNIEGLLPFEFRSLNETRMIYYRINGYVQLTELIQGEVLAMEYLADLFLHIIKLIHDMSMYMLQPDNLIINIKNVYFNSSDKRFGFVFCPNYETDIRRQLKSLTEECMKLVNHKDRQAVDMAYGIYDIVSKPNYDIQEIQNYIGSFRKATLRSQSTEKENSSISTVNATKSHETSYRYNEQKQLMDMLFSKDSDIVYVEPDKSFANNRKRIKEHVASEKKEIKWNYKKICIIAIIVTGIVGIVIALIQFKSTYHVEYVKLLMGVLMLMAIECFVYLQLGKQDTDKKEELLKFTEDKFNSDETLFERIDRNKLQIEVSKVPKLSDDLEAGTDILNAEEDTVLLIEDGANTTVLRDGEENNIVFNHEQKHLKTYRLIPCMQDCSDSIDIYSATVIIGRDKTKANYVIDNQTVSRLHAKAYTRNNHLIIEDMNSTNGTYINDCAVKNGQPVIADKGDIVSFGNIRYSVATEI
ncbi:MAG: FHA domain-containing protein [Coprococcus sp.]|nr:FHA domain-containing protein [Coprococcus sp.]